MTEKPDVPSNADLLGYERYSHIQPRAADDFLSIIAAVLPANEWALIGGAAVVLHLGRSRRVISPDLDLYLSPASERVIRVVFEQLAPGAFGYLLNYRGLAVDLLIAAEPWQQEAVCLAMAIAGYQVVTLPYLIVAKVVAGRDKDLEDLALIYAFAPQAFVEASLLCTFAGVEAEDFDSTMALIRVLVAGTSLDDPSV